MAEPDRDVDRRIGLAIWKDCIAAYAPVVAATLGRAAPATTQTTAKPSTKANPSVATSDGFWRRLPDGGWGISLNYKTPLGSTVRISNKSGEIQDVVVGRLVSDANGYWLHAIGKPGEVFEDEEPTEESTVSDDGAFLEYEQRKPKSKHRSKHKKQLSNSEQLEELEASESSGYAARLEEGDDGVPW